MIELLGEFVLLDFLMGKSIAEVTALYEMHSQADAENLLRQLLLRHGYAAASEEKRHVPTA